MHRFGLGATLLSFELFAFAGRYGANWRRGIGR